MAKSRRMAALGRRGGLRGGAARARALSARERTRIARSAARARWRRPALVLDETPRDHGELSAFIAHHGSRAARGRFHGNLEDVALDAVTQSRRDPALARMLPVFLWRNRAALVLDDLARKSGQRREIRTLGYFLELAGTLGADSRLVAMASRLRRRSHAHRPTYFFASAVKHPFEAMMAEQRTPPEARRWGLLTGTPTDSFATYFHKVRDL